MIITYLKPLQNYPARSPHETPEDQFAIEGISIAEIEALELEYNQGNIFPKALRELLFLGGGFNYIFDGFLNKKGQDYNRDMFDSVTKIGSRPFFVLADYSSSFWIVYLDEGDNPVMYDVRKEFQTPEDPNFLNSRNLDTTITDFVKESVSSLIEYNNSQ